MPGSISNFLELELLDHTLKVGAYTPATNLYMAYSTTDPLDDGSGITEPVGNGYARKLYNDWDTAASRASANTNVISFPVATGSQGTITHWAMFDDPTAGNMLAHGALENSIAVNDGNTAAFAAGLLDITVTTGGVSTYLANKWLDHFLKVSSFTVPTNLYAIASDTTIVDADTGSTISEPSGGSYARELVNTWDVAASGASANTSAIEFTQATGNWGTITDSGLVDASSVGNLLFYSALNSSANVEDTDTFKFGVGVFAITLD